MTIFANKALWAVDLDDQTDEDRIFGHAQAMGAEAVVIRTTSGRLATSMARFQAAGMKVYAWRWPAVVKDQGGRYAIDEANYVAQTLIPAGLDGLSLTRNRRMTGAITTGIARTCRYQSRNWPPASAKSSVALPRLRAGQASCSALRRAATIRPLW